MLLSVPEQLLQLRRRALVHGEVSPGKSSRFDMGLSTLAELCPGGGLRFDAEICK